jgi:hypothetical protein
MPFAVAVYMALVALAERRAEISRSFRLKSLDRRSSAKAFWSNAGDNLADVDDDSILFE